MSEYCACFVMPQRPRNPFYFFGRAIEHMEDSKEVVRRYASQRQGSIFLEDEVISQYWTAFDRDGFAVSIGIVSYPEFLNNYVLACCENRRTLEKVVREFSRELKEVGWDDSAREIVDIHCAARGWRRASGDVH